MDKKKSLFFGAIAIDIVLIFLSYLVFYEKSFDENISTLLTWIVIIGTTFMMIVTIALAITIPRKKHIKIRRRPKKGKKEERPLKEVEFKEVIEDGEEKEEELPEFKVVEEVPVKTVEKQDLEHITSKSGITVIRRVTQEDLDEIKGHVDEGKSDFKDEIQQVIDTRAKEVEETVDDLIHSKMEKSEKLVSQNEIKKTTVKQRKKAITNEEKINNYLKEHPDATASEVRKAVGCKLSSAKRYRGLWLKNEGN